MAAAAPAPAASPSAAAPRGTPTGLIAGAAVAVLAAGAAGYAWLGRSPAPAPAPVAAPAAAPAPVPAAAPAPAWSMEALYARVLQARTPGFEVQAVPNKTALRIGRDELSFTVTSQRDGFLSVQLYGSDGVSMLLYPNGQTGPVKLRAGQPLTLPKAPTVFTTTAPAGPNLLLVMVSEHPRDFSALQPRSDGPYKILPSGELAQRLDAGTRRGNLPVQAGAPRCPDGGSDCPDAFGAVVMRVDAVN